MIYSHSYSCECSIPLKSLSDPDLLLRWTTFREDTVGAGDCRRHLNIDCEDVKHNNTTTNPWDKMLLLYNTQSRQGSWKSTLKQTAVTRLSDWAQKKRGKPEQVKKHQEEGLQMLFFDIKSRKNTLLEITVTTLADLLMSVRLRSIQGQQRK